MLVRGLESGLDTFSDLASLTIMYPQRVSASVVEPQRFAVYHAIREFSQGVGFLAETGNTADVAALMERFTEAMVSQADAHAAATIPPKLPGWAASLFVALVVGLLTMSVNGLMRFSSLESQVAALQSVHPEGISVLSTKIDEIDKQVKELNQRVYDLSTQKR